MTITVTATWEKAMRRALAAGMKATKRADGTFTVPSQSNPGTIHTVTLNAAGHITSCDCKGWARFGRKNACKHAGAVAIALSALAGNTLEAPKATVPAEMPVQSLRGGRSRLFAPEAA
jgi:hypothetical protein